MVCSTWCRVYGIWILHMVFGSFHIYLRLPSFPTRRDVARKQYTYIFVSGAESVTRAFLQGGSTESAGMEIRSQEPYHIWLLCPNSRMAVSVSNLYLHLLSGMVLEL